MEAALDEFQSPAPGVTEEQYLLDVEEQWNKRVDKEVQVLGNGLEKLIEDFQSGLAPSSALTESSSLASTIHTSKILTAAENVLALAHQLKLMILLSDQAGKEAVVKEEEGRIAFERKATVGKVEEALREVASGR